ncbi:MAG TPA: site-2 protease family protein [Phycisphaerales bacterium]|nr:site-2 protease family protein [Phycisphaerales bacterium]
MSSYPHGSEASDHPHRFPARQQGAPEGRARSTDKGGVIGRGLRLPFSLMGIPLILDWSFLIVLPLMAFMIGGNVAYFADTIGIPGGDRLAEPATRYTLGLVAAVGLFVCVLLHELGHAVTARLYKVEVKSITLWFLGGMAHIAEMPRRRGGEAVVALVGPLVSFALAAVLYVGLRGAVASGAVGPGAMFVLAYLALVNVMLGAFNLLPALPLDGGRILRSLLAMAMPHSKATRIAAVISRVIAAGLAVLGLMTGNLFTVFVAVFIFLGVQGERRHSIVEGTLEGLRVSDLMSRDVRYVHPWMTVSELTSVMLDEHHLGFPVLDEQGKLVGLISLRELTRSPRPSPGALVGEVMVSPAPTISEVAAATEAVRQLGVDTHARLVVVGRDGGVAGIITGADIMRAIQVRTLGEEWYGRRAA